MYKKTRSLRLPLLTTSALVLLAVSGCKEEVSLSPDQTYQTYYSKVIEGRSFEEDLGYHAKIRQDEVLSSLDARSKATGQAEEQIKKAYIDFTHGLAKCGKLSLLNETIDGGNASLNYAVEDICDTDFNSKLNVKMILEKGGWKIVSDEIKMVSK